MKTLSLMAATLLLSASLVAPVWAELPTLKMTEITPSQITTPDKVDTSIGELEFFDGIPTKDTISTVYDYVDRARAVEVYINMIPAVSMFNIRKGQRAIGANEYNQIAIWEELMDSKAYAVYVQSLH